MHAVKLFTTYDLDSREVLFAMTAREIGKLGFLIDSRPYHEGRIVIQDNLVVAWDSYKRSRFYKLTVDAFTNYFKRLMLVSLLTEMLVTEYLTQSLELIINKFGITLEKLKEKASQDNLPCLTICSFQRNLENRRGLVIQ